MFLLISGKEVEIGDKSTYVLATVLKEFFRSLPESLICSEIFAEMCSTKDITDSTERIEEMKRYFINLCKENQKRLTYHHLINCYFRKHHTDHRLSCFDIRLYVQTPRLICNKSSTVPGIFYEIGRKHIATS